MLQCKTIIKGGILFIGSGLVYHLIECCKYKV